MVVANFCIGEVVIRTLVVMWWSIYYVHWHLHANYSMWYCMCLNGACFAWPYRAYCNFQGCFCPGSSQFFSKLHILNVMYEWVVAMTFFFTNADIGQHLTGILPALKPWLYHNKVYMTKYNLSTENTMMPTTLGGEGDVAIPSHFYAVVVRCVKGNGMECEQHQLDVIGLFFLHPTEFGESKWIWKFQMTST